MNPLTVARWQFGITTVYHFLFVPLTLGLSLTVAVLQTIWYRTGEERWLRMTRFWGKLFLINFAMGVVTGIVQEFQFGMAWSSYSRFVGDVFGAPLAMEALVAFFLESTFLGLWIFGWDRLSSKVHLATIWAAAIGTNISAFFILAANSWMQHPVGVRYNPVTHRAEMRSITAVLTNSTVLAAYPHTLFGAFMTAGAFLVGISAWHLRAKRVSALDLSGFKSVFRGGLVLVFVAGLGVGVSGHVQARLMFEQQPMKMASAEALCRSEKAAGFSLFAYGDPGGDCNVRSLSIPGGTAFLATDNANATIKGVKDLQQSYSARYGSGPNYKPNMAVTYWSFRLMIGFGFLGAGLALWGLWRSRRGRDATTSRWFTRLAVLGIGGPFVANSMGWIFTEMGRQPWIVAPNPTGLNQVRLLTASGISPTLGAGTLLTSLIAFTLVYGVLAVIECRLLLGVVRGGPAGTMPAEPESDEADDRLTFAY